MSDVDWLAEKLRDIQEHLDPQEDGDALWSELRDRDRSFWRSSVRGLLQVMREPTPAQYQALCATNKMWREQTSETVWKTYIDALLNEPPDDLGHHGPKARDR